MLEAFIEILYVFIIDGIRSLLAIIIGFFISLSFPKPIRKHLHPDELWKHNELNYKKIIWWFLIGALALSIFYTLVDTSQLTSGFD